MKSEFNPIVYAIQKISICFAICAGIALLFILLKRCDSPTPLGRVMAAERPIVLIAKSDKSIVVEAGDGEVICVSTEFNFATEIAKTFQVNDTIVKLRNNNSYE